MAFGGLKQRVARTLARALSPIGPDSLRRALDKATGGKSELLMFHSSLSACGNFKAGPDDILDALTDVCGTLALPTHSYSYPAAKGEPGPVFDPAATPSKNGLLTERFRHRPGALRSINATHSLAAAGPLAAKLTEGHEALDAPCGSGSPYDRLVQRKGSVLLFGVSFHSYTPYHTAEDAAESPFAYEQGTIDQLRYIGADGLVHDRPSRRQSWTPRRFREAGDLIEKAGLATRTPLGRSFLLFVPDAAKVHDFLVERLRKTPDFLYLSCAAPLI